MTIERMHQGYTLSQKGAEQLAAMLDDSEMRCPGCDCDPVGYAPHNGKGDCAKETDLKA